MPQRVRVRFAPSPTGGLHLGGVRTALFNFLFARQHGGDFILRIEDTDQSRYVPGAEDYILDCLSWCGLEPDEGPRQGGPYGPYRQSERKDRYRRYAEQLVAGGHAYYAFDTPGELETMRRERKTARNPSPQYDHTTRGGMRNSLTLPEEETRRLLEAGTPHVIRFLMPPDEEVFLEDLIRGEVKFSTSLLDDKVLLKADGMPTYHLAVVVDDHEMQISHVFRGEEWLSSTPLHILVGRRLGWESDQPRWAHFPLILKPDGKGKLSKRDGDRLGFPVYAMNWTDPVTGETSEGFRERGFLAEAFVNMLALIGWNDGSEQEIFSMAELTGRFTLERVHKGGAKFNYEKARWFNHEYLKRLADSALVPVLRQQAADRGVAVTDERLLQVIALIKDRCTLLGDLWEESAFFFRPPEHLDVESVSKKWDENKKAFFEILIDRFGAIRPSDGASFEAAFQALAAEQGLKPGGLMLPLRVMLVGGKFGPPVFSIAGLLGAEECLARIQAALPAFG